ncbi:MAG: phosphotransferase [Clostridia bacterium]|nr:phosphotransferase [Clostridia bacterium]
MNLDRVIAVRNTKTIYRDGDRCLKVYNESHPKWEVLDAALNQARVEATGLNVPKVLEVVSIDGKWTLVTDYVVGKTLEQLMLEDEEKKDEYLNRFVDIQLKVSEKKCPALTRLRERMHERIDGTDLNATIRYDLHTRLNSLPKDDKLLHGDFYPANVIIANSGEAYIIDWSHAAKGCPAADAAQTYLLFYMKGDFATAERYLELYCEKSDTPKQIVQKWMPIAAAARLEKGVPQEKEFLMDWVNIADYS